MKFLALLCAPAFVVGVIGGAFHGNPIALSIIFGFVAPIALSAAIVCAPAKRRPRRADPAKVARLERELGMEPSEAPTHAGPRVWAFTETGDIRPDEQTTEERCETCGAGPGECFAEPLPCGREAPKPPDERNVEDCPRPEGCVVAHPCRKCGARRGRPCFGDPYGGQVAEMARRIEANREANREAIEHADRARLARYNRRIR